MIPRQFGTEYKITEERLMVSETRMYVQDTGQDKFDTCRKKIA